MLYLSLHYIQFYYKKSHFKQDSCLQVFATKIWMTKYLYNLKFNLLIFTKGAYSVYSKIIFNAIGA